jgi:hypothetical protein
MVESSQNVGIPLTGKVTSALNGYQKVSLNWQLCSGTKNACQSLSINLSCIEGNGDCLQVIINGEPIDITEMYWEGGKEQIQKLKMALQKSDFVEASQVVETLHWQASIFAMQIKETDKQKYKKYVYICDLLRDLSCYFKLQIEGDDAYSLSEDFCSDPQKYSHFIEYGDSPVSPEILFVAGVYLLLQNRYNIEYTEFEDVDPGYSQAIAIVTSDAQNGKLPIGYDLQWALHNAFADTKTKDFVLKSNPNLFSRRANFFTERQNL